MNSDIVRVAVPAPFADALDYLPTHNGKSHPIGTRVLVPLGKRTVVGMVAGHEKTSEVNAARLRRILSDLDSAPLLPIQVFETVAWAAKYYFHPLGEALLGALPRSLRDGKTVGSPLRTRYRRREAEVHRRLGREQKRLLDMVIAAGSVGLLPDELSTADRARLVKLNSYGLLEIVPESLPLVSEPHTTLSDEQSYATSNLIKDIGHFSTTVIEGVTGSGKTEVYMEVVREVLKRRQQALILVPEISLTPQLLKRLEVGLGIEIAPYHSALTESDRLRVWQRARLGMTQVVVGTRSAVFLPLRNLGLLVVDEEHDSSFKQQEGFRYHARDVAVYRGQREQVPVVLCSATPSMETILNRKRGRYKALFLRERARGSRTPTIRVVDLRQRNLTGGMSPELLELMGRHLDSGGQVMLFLNRRGYSPVVTCPNCGEGLECRHCSARLTWHKADGRLMCHYCGTARSLPTSCPSCNHNGMRLTGQGTEQIESVIKDLFPSAVVVRIDRDSTRRKGRLSALLDAAQTGAADILIGTQMLAKGHDFGNLTLAAILDADQGLLGPDFRAPERMAQLLVQVAGRAGRRATMGDVVVQTRQPQNPLLQRLLCGGYFEFAKEVLSERQIASLPPYKTIALLRAEASSEHKPERFLISAGAVLSKEAGVSFLGPAPAPLARKAGRYRYQILLEATSRLRLHAALRRCYFDVLKLPQARGVRVSLDIDPIDLT